MTFTMNNGAKATFCQTADTAKELLEVDNVQEIDFDELTDEDWENGALAIFIKTPSSAWLPARCYTVAC